MSSGRIALIAALPGELKPLVKGWRRLPVGSGKGMVMHRGKIGRHEILAVASGIGTAGATAGWSAVNSFDEKPSAVVSVGWAGALSCGAKTGRAYSVAEVVDSRTGERFQASFHRSEDARVKLVTASAVADVAEKKRLAEAYGASLVDMEAVTVARLSQARGVPFYCVKGVSDGATDQLPDFNRFVGKGGQLHMGRFVSYAIVRPALWPGLIRLGENSRMAAEAMAGMVSEVLAGADGER
jgi:adenosylhomocysteine nucleosidase